MKNPFRKESDHFPDTKSVIPSVKNILPEANRAEWSKFYDNWMDSYDYIPPSPSTWQKINVPVSSLLATQPFTYGQSETEGPPYVMEFKGKYAIVDGHHRIVDQILDGATSIDALLVPQANIEKESQLSVADDLLDIEDGELNVGPPYQEDVPNIFRGEKKDAAYRFNAWFHDVYELTDDAPGTSHEWTSLDPARPQHEYTLPTFIADGDEDSFNKDAVSSMEPPPEMVSEIFKKGKDGKRKTFTLNFNPKNWNKDYNLENPRSIKVVLDSSNEKAPQYHDGVLLLPQKPSLDLITHELVHYVQDIIHEGPHSGGPNRDMRDWNPYYEEIFDRQELGEDEESIRKNPPDIEKHEMSDLEFYPNLMQWISKNKDISFDEFQKSILNDDLFITLKNNNEKKWKKAVSVAVSYLFPDGKKEDLTELSSDWYSDDYEEEFNTDEYLEEDEHPESIMDRTLPERNT